MANWKYQIDVRKEWKRAETQEITPQELARVIAEKLKALPCFSDDDDLQNIVEAFEELNLDDAATFDDFDEIMNGLYDWGDQEVSPYGKWPRNAMCWIGAAI
uniref:Uncharacterized protein n=1 Tax=viral metagenome TaxID=1070528 RepID=A0A6M3KLC9_9ZZZZ